MQPKILFITNRYFFQPTVSALNRINPDCGTKVVSYDSFGQIPQVYDQYADGYDAVLITGTSAKHVLDIIYPNNPKPVAAYQVDSDGLHRDILRFAIETQNLDFSRIAVDFLVPLDCGDSVVDFLKLDSMVPVIRKNDSMTESVDLCEPRSLERLILDRIVSLWQQRAIDMVLCLYASIVPDLQEMGIPFRCPFVSDSQLSRVIEEMLVKIELKKLHDNHPAVIQVFPRYSQDGSAERFSRLHQTIRQLAAANMIDCVIQNTDSSCLIISTMQILRFLTNDFQVCRISAELEEHLDFPCSVAYGVGTSISHAMNNVQIASREAKLLGHPFVVDSNGTLIGPLNSEKRMVISPNSMPDVSDIAKRCSLSAMTIQKLMAIVRSTGSDKITTQELAQRLDTTIRNANRIMLNLCKGNVARPVYTQTSHSRGRPIQVYALDFGIS